MQRDLAGDLVAGRNLQVFGGSSRVRLTVRVAAGTSGFGARARPGVHGSVARVTTWWMEPGVNSTWVEWMDVAARLAAIVAVVQFVLLVAWWRRDRRRGMLAT